MYSVKLTNIDSNTSIDLDNIVADGVIEAVGIRWFADKDGARYEAPMQKFLVKFSSERNKLMEAQDK